MYDIASTSKNLSICENISKDVFEKVWEALGPASSMAARFLLGVHAALKSLGWTCPPQSRRGGGYLIYEHTGRCRWKI